MTLQGIVVPEIDTTKINLLDLDRFASGVPHEWFTHLRRHAPIAHHPEPNGPGFYVFTRHEDIAAIGRDVAHFSSDAARGPIVGLEEPDAQQVAVMEVADAGVSMIATDPPVHSRYRRLVNRGFTPRMIGLLEDRIREIAAKLVADAVEKGDIDFVNDLAVPLPLIVIAEMMGIPEEDRQRVFHWTNQFLGQDDPEFSSTIEDITQAVVDFYNYAQELAARSRQHPGDDIMTNLLSADSDGDRLSDMDFNRFFELLVLAGNETTRTALTHGMMALIEHPAEYERLAADPSLIGTATDEILRWASPVLYFRRNVIEDFEYKGVQLRTGDKVSIWYVSANFDERVFADPTRFDIGRSPNPLVSFGGGGPHYCLGANLARLEIRILFDELVKRVRVVEQLAPASLLRSNFLRGVKHYPVRLHPRA